MHLEKLQKPWKISERYLNLKRNQDIDVKLAFLNLSKAKQISWPITSGARFFKKMKASFRCQNLKFSSANKIHRCNIYIKFCPEKAKNVVKKRHENSRGEKGLQTSEAARMGGRKMLIFGL